MRIEPGQKILIEIPSAANVHVVAAVQEVVEEDASASAAAAKAGSGGCVLSCDRHSLLCISVSLYLRLQCHFSCTQAVATVLMAFICAGITINTAGMGQAPFWVAFIGGLTVLKMIRQKAAGRGILDNKDAKYIPQS